MRRQIGLRQWPDRPWVHVTIGTLASQASTMPATDSACIWTTLLFLNAAYGGLRGGVLRCAGAASFLLRRA